MRDETAIERRGGVRGGGGGLTGRELKQEGIGGTDALGEKTDPWALLFFHTRLAV